MAKFNGIENYIASFPPNVQEILQRIRELIRKEAPEAIEALGYGVPSFKLNSKPLVYYAAFKNHIGVYPVPETNEKVSLIIKTYQTGKGTLRFDLNKDIPYEFIREIVSIRIKEVTNQGEK